MNSKGRFVNAFQSLKMIGNYEGEEPVIGKLDMSQKVYLPNIPVEASSKELSSNEISSSTSASSSADGSKFTKSNFMETAPLANDKFTKNNFTEAVITADSPSAEENGSGTAGFADDSFVDIPGFDALVPSLSSSRIPGLGPCEISSTEQISDEINEFMSTMDRPDASEESGRNGELTSPQKLNVTDEENLYDYGMNYSKSPAAATPTQAENPGDELYNPLDMMIEDSDSDDNQPPPPTTSIPPHGWNPMESPPEKQPDKPVENSSENPPVKAAEADSTDDMELEDEMDIDEESQGNCDDEDASDMLYGGLDVSNRSFEDDGGAADEKTFDDVDVDLLMEQIHQADIPVEMVGKQFSAPEEEPTEEPTEENTEASIPDSEEEDNAAGADVEEEADEGGARGDVSRIGKSESDEEMDVGDEGPVYEDDRGDILPDEDVAEEEAKSKPRMMIEDDELLGTALAELEADLEASQDVDVDDEDDEEEGVLAEIERAKREAERHQEKSGSRHREKTGGRRREKSADKNHEQSSERHRDKKEERHREKEEDRRKEKGEERHKEKVKEKRRDKSEEKRHDKSEDKIRAKAEGKHREKHIDKHVEKSMEKRHAKTSRDKDDDPPREQLRDRSREQPTERKRDKEEVRKKEKSSTLLREDKKQMKPFWDDGAERDERESEAQVEGPALRQPEGPAPQPMIADVIIKTEPEDEVVKKKKKKKKVKVKDGKLNKSKDGKKEKKKKKKKKPKDGEVVDPEAKALRKAEKKKRKEEKRAKKAVKRAKKLAKKEKALIAAVAAASADIDSIDEEAQRARKMIRLEKEKKKRKEEDAVAAKQAAKAVEKLEKAAMKRSKADAADADMEVPRSERKRGSIEQPGEFSAKKRARQRSLEDAQRSVDYEVRVPEKNTPSRTKDVSGTSIAQEKSATKRSRSVTPPRRDSKRLSATKEQNKENKKPSRKEAPAAVAEASDDSGSSTSDSDSEMRLQKTRRQLERENKRRLEEQKVALLQELVRRDTQRDAEMLLEKQRQEEAAASAVHWQTPVAAVKEHRDARAQLTSPPSTNRQKLLALEEQRAAREKRLAMSAASIIEREAGSDGEADAKRKRIALDVISPIVDKLVVDDGAHEEDVADSSNEGGVARVLHSTTHHDPTTDSSGNEENSMLKKRSTELGKIRAIENMAVVADLGVELKKRDHKRSNSAGRDELFEDVFGNRDESAAKEVLEIPSSTAIHLSSGDDAAVKDVLETSPSYTKRLPVKSAEVVGVEPANTDYFSEKHAKKIPILDVTGQKISNSPQSPDSTNPPIVQLEDSPYNPEGSPLPFGNLSGNSPSVVIKDMSMDTDIDFNAYKDVVAFDDIMKSKVKQEARKARRKKEEQTRSGVGNQLDALEPDKKKKVALVDYLVRQRQVEEEMKNVLRPYFKKKEITKDEYKEILKKAVPQVTMSQSHIVPQRIESLMKKFISKSKGARKKVEADAQQAARAGELQQQEEELQKLQIQTSEIYAQSFPQFPTRVLNPNLPMPPV